MAQSRTPKGSRSSSNPAIDVREASIKEPAPKSVPQDLRQQFQALGAKVTELRETLASERKERIADADAVAEMLVRISEKEVEVRRAVTRAEVAEARAEAAEAAESAARKEAEVERVARSRAEVAQGSARKEVGALQARVLELEQELGKRGDDQIGVGAALDAAQRDLDEERAARHAAQRRADDEKAALSKKIEDLEAELRELAADKKSIDELLDAADEESTREAEKLQDLELMLGKARQELEAARVEAEEASILRPKLEHATGLIGSLKVKLSMRENAAKKAAAELDEVKKTATTVEADLAKRLADAERERAELASGVAQREAQLAEAFVLVDAVSQGLAASGAVAAKIRETLDGLARKEAESANLRIAAASLSRQVSEQLAELAQSLRDKKD